MAITINGTGSITGLTAGGLPDGSITTDDLAANAVTAAKLAAGAGGKILQAQNAHKTDAESYSPSTTWTDVASLSASITPASASNKVLVTATVNAATDARAHFRILRDSTAIAIGDAAGSRVQAFASDFQRAGGPSIHSASISWLDSPSATSSTTYKIQVRADGPGTVYVNRPESTIDSGSYGRNVCSLILLEVSA